jgi:cell division protein FtsZ
VACPLLEGIDLSGAKGVLVLISAAKGSLKLSESKLAMNTIRAYASNDAHVIYGTAYDDKLGDQIRVTVVATGLSRQSKRPTLVVTQQPQVALRNGTDGLAYSQTTPSATATGHQTTGMLTGASTIGSSIGRTQPDYGSMVTPSVWRTRDRTSAAAKVDALSNGGMDDFEIPAFLRKQAD